MIIKKYNQFLKEEVTMADTAPVETPVETPTTTPRPSRPNVIPSIKPGQQDAPLAELEENEEEGGDIYASKLKELASKLGVEVVDNSVEYNGKKINVYSEDDKYHIDGVKKGFTTSDEVVSYFEKNDAPVSEIQNESKSYRNTRDFKSYKK